VDPERSPPRLTDGLGHDVDDVAHISNLHHGRQSYRTFPLGRIDGGSRSIARARTARAYNAT
jgi:hypothetical protein